MHKIPLLSALKKDRWVKPFLTHYKRTLYLAIGLGILTFICAGGLMFVSGYLISKSATHPFNILAVYVPIVITRGFGIFRPVFRYAERLTSHNWVFKMTSEFRKKMYDSLEQDAVFFNSKYRLGDILGLLSEDVAHIQNLYLRTIFPEFVAIGLYLLIVVALGILSWWYGLVMLLLLGVIMVAIPFWSVVVNGAKQEAEKQLKNDLYQDLTDNVMGITDWVFANRGEEYVRQHIADEDKLYRIQESLNRFNQMRTFLIEVWFLLIAISLALWGVAQFGGHYGGSANWIAAFVLATFPLVEAFAGLPAAAQESNIYVDSIDRLNQLPAVANTKPAPVELTGPYDLEVQDVHYTYPETTKEVLKGVTINLQAGQKLAILGRSGSGKSTLAALLRGDRKPTHGKITLNGIPTSEFGDEMADYIGVIQQQPYLFHTTLLNNLRIGNEGASEAEIWDVLARVGLKETIAQLPDGLQTMVDEAGLRFSGGERHRLSLARILLKDVPIVILDEPTVGLDPITEQAVIDTFFKQLEGKTIIWITHHLQGIEAMDRVIFIEDGQLEMDGTPQALMKTNERYRRLKLIDAGEL
ncbi:thiol reductant ABC exporter subunit CydC [Limosilactobacillus gastricus]|uniref:ABC transporter, CydDC cysteine exporter (CydDC-E) family, permease ATP-binding protein CydC n=1 Tax=Limosilactobacillus gastricus DSM 16045 TaxID=1423749 RepID=A0A0R1V5Q2_9LACO|nr:thiol reductant ABC exporter subunit CydC [Limosilactobacillus gastricus]KRM00816.1 ABC transporter, CydDC cysteine exporter (CydDC-E) family, permease ATP-binding protein CydC [Limosilactobacillus gastricus DSM 16045]QGF40289.1 thiol reductant ABC exporter subunit CydC [Limosilactobacillus gastricus]